MNIQKYLNAYIKIRKSWNHIGARTAELEKQSFKIFCAKHGDKEMSDITRQDVVDYTDGLLETLSSNTAAVHFGHLHRAFKQAYIEEVIDRSPFDRVRAPKRSKDRDVRILDEDELGILLSAAAEMNNAQGYAIQFAALTGCRRGEVCGLRWKSVDLEAGKVYICESMVPLASGPTLLAPKTPNSYRWIRLPDSFVSQLAAMKGDQRDNDLVFKIHPATLSRAVKKLAGECGFAGRVTLHSLRHAHATHLLKGKVYIGHVSARLGHASPSVTYNTYCHVLRGDARDEELTMAMGERVIRKYQARDIPERDRQEYHQQPKVRRQV